MSAIYFARSGFIKRTFRHAVARRSLHTETRSVSRFSTTQWTTRGLIGMNVCIFLCWTVSKSTPEDDASAIRANRSQETMNRNWLLSLQNYREGRWYTTITSAFSHQLAPHLLFNMVTLNAFSGIFALAGVGGLRTLGVYLASGIGGSVAFLYQASEKERQEPRAVKQALGASGAVMGMGTMAACLMPLAPMNFMFIPVSIPLWMMTGAFVGIDTYFLDSGSPIGHSAHLGGAVTGAVFYLLFARRLGGIATRLRGR